MTNIMHEHLILPGNDSISETLGDSETQYMSSIHDENLDEFPSYPSNFFENLTILVENLSIALNYSSGNYDPRLVEKFEKNRSINDDRIHYSIMLAYIIMIILGAVGNILVVIVIVRKATMRTVRNVFILNLAISDMLLCLITMPLTLAEVLSHYWPFGHFPVLCKLFGTLQAISIFVSSITITAIALDRYQVSRMIFQVAQRVL